jgi:hypothetical protein
MKFGVGIIYKTTREQKFCESLLRESHISLEGVYEFLFVHSIFVEWFGLNSIVVRYWRFEINAVDHLKSFVTIGAVKSMLYLEALMEFCPIFYSFRVTGIYFGTGDVQKYVFNCCEFRGIRCNESCSTYLWVYKELLSVLCTFAVRFRWNSV